MHVLAIVYLVFALFLFLIFVLFAKTFMGLWLTEVGLWIVWLPLGLLVSGAIVILRFEVLAFDKLNFVFILISILLNLYTSIRVLVPFFEIKKTNFYLEQAMKFGLGDDYLDFVDPMVDAKYFKTVKFRFLHYLIGARPRKLLEKVARVKDITFFKDETIDLKLNVYYPKRDGVFPTIVFIHGGAFILGSKDRPKHEKLCMMLANYGYTVFSLDYRLTPLEFLSKKKSLKDELLFAAMLSDVHHGVVFAKKHAHEYKGNANELFLFGRSAGGHLALLTTFSCMGKFFEFNEQTGKLEEYKISGVIAFYPPTNFSTLYNYYGKKNLLKFLMERGMGGSPDEVQYLYRFFSPVNYVTSKNSQFIPPVFLAVGAKDRLVAPEQSEELYAQLRKFNIPSVLLTLPWANHGFDAILNGPGGQLVIKYLTQFLVWVLTKEKYRRLDSLAHKHGLDGLTRQEKIDILCNLNALKDKSSNEEKYNQFIIDCFREEIKKKEE
ncbi:MAG: alpha/beta hydrolase [Candidatus Heimdallarchaeota archaeon]|nr:alpha/beta hydrolase [Candidatus Heimdallarchaeota archaeon]